MFKVKDKVRFQIVPSYVFSDEILDQEGQTKIIAFLNQTAVVMATSSRAVNVCIKWDSDSYYSWVSPDCIRRID